MFSKPKWQNKEFHMYVPQYSDDQTSNPLKSTEYGAVSCQHIADSESYSYREIKLLDAFIFNSSEFLAQPPH